jgi:cytochrome c-type biogenesis protein CcmF
MLANLGYFSLLISFIAALYAAAASIIGARRGQAALVASARNAALAVWPLISFACLCLILLLVTQQYQIEYVAQVSSRAMPAFLKVTALWGGQAGSLLFWSWLMAAYAASAMLRRWERDRPLMPYAIAVMCGTVAFFLALVAFVENPFARLWQVAGSLQPVAAMLPPPGSLPFTPADGQGLNPLLRHPGMIIHPPMLYAGFVGFVVPYAFAIAALATGRSDDEWVRTTRRWTLVAWLFLSLGLILGGRWAYDVLGWGGYWGWDPVENAAFMPWLTGTAFLHSVMIQEKRGMFKQWNMILIILTYALVIFGTFLTRSGVLSSVHAFAQSAIGPLFFAFIAVTFIGSLALLFRRWAGLQGEHQLDSLLSREAAFLLNNVLFLGILVAVFWGTVFPMISEIFTGQKISVGPPYYNRVTGPLFAALVLLMGVAPLVAWRQASARSLGRLLLFPLAVAAGMVAALLALGIRNPGALLGFGLAAFVALATLAEFWRGTRARMRTTGESAPAALAALAARNRRRYGGYVIHLGVVLMTVGVVGTNFFQQETQGTLALGQQVTLGRYVMTFDDLQEFTLPDDRAVTRATVTVYRDGKYLATLHPRRDFYFTSQQPMTIPGVRSSIEDDFYVLLVAWEPMGVAGATFKLYLNPLVNWIWMGGLVFIAGTLIAAWPEAEPATAARRRRAALPATAGAD